MEHGSRIVHRRRSSISRSSGWRLFARTVAARAYPRLIMNVREKWWLVFDIVLPLDRAVRVRVRLSREQRAGRSHRLRHHRRRDERVLDERAVVDGEPALLGEGDRQPGALHHGAELDDGDSARHGARRHVHDDGARGQHPRDRQPAVRRQLRGRERSAAGGGVRAGARGAVRDGDDVRVDVPAAWPRGVASREPGAGAGVSAVGDVFPDPQLQLLGGGRRVDHSADAGARRDPSVVVLVGRELGFLDVRTEVAVLAVLVRRVSDRRARCLLDSN